jgi:hypothetical protein
VARLLLAVPVLPAVAVLFAAPMLLAAPVSDGSCEPQPALIPLISATIAKAASGRVVLLMVAPWCVEIGLTPALCRSARITAASSDRP